MKNKFFWIFLFLIILFGLATKIYAVSGNRIFFTVDEGRDAIYARQIINYHEIFTKGPQATLLGLYTGPLWYYFAAIGYAIFRGNPVGVVYILTILNLAVVFVLIIKIKKEVDSQAALIIGFALMVFWEFFTTSLWGFNPFALLPLALILILLLIKNKYGLGALIIILAFNAELAGAVALFLFYIVVGFVFIFQRKINLKKFLICAFFIPFLGVAKILIDFLKTPRSHIVSSSVHIGGVNFKQMALEFTKMLGQTTIPQNVYLGFLFLIVIVIIYIKLKNKNKFIKNFVFLISILISTSYLFFGSNHGWSAWHTAFIPPLTLIAVILMCWEYKKIGKILIAIILLLQIISFRNNYLDYLKPSPNPSLLYNQLKVLDWVYGHSEGNGFNLYTYTNSYYDYSYQYLVGSFGKTKYGFYPCEYSNFPLSIKSLYIPGVQNYVEPKLGCDKFRFLIIDSSTNGNLNKDWINDFRSQTVFIEKVQIGGTTIEKRKIPDKIR